MFCGWVGYYYCFKRFIFQIICMCIHEKKPKKRELDTLISKLQMVMCYCVSAGNPALILYKSSHLWTTRPFLLKRGSVQQF